MMRFSTILHRGDIVLVPFPFTDLTGQKVRPAAIVSPDPIGEDIILAFITSVIPSPLLPTDFLLEKSHLEFPLAGLKAASVFRTAKLITLHRSLILRRLGKAGPQIQQDLHRRLEKAIGLQRPWIRHQQKFPPSQGRRELLRGTTLLDGPVIQSNH